MTQFKDIAHFYLGCDVYSTGSKYMGKLVSVSINDQAIVVHPEGDQRGAFSYISWLKPILRPLTDMTEDEAEHFALLCLNSPHAPEGFDPITKDEIQIELVPNDNGLMLDNDVELYIGVACRCISGFVAIMKDGRIGFSKEDDTLTSDMNPVDDIYNKVYWLIKQGFDVFGLISSMQAIDKTNIEEVK